MNKVTLRKKTLTDRKKLSLSAVAEKSGLIVEYIVNSHFFHSAGIIACYFAYKNEVNLNSLLGNADKVILFPRVVQGTLELDFYIVRSISDFERGVFGLMEPKTTLPKVDICNIDLFLTPGVAFSKTGERIGYGGGYYDTTFQKKKKESTALGVCFDLQIVPSGFAEKWDKKVEGIVTESGINIIKDI